MDLQEVECWSMDLIELAQVSGTFLCGNELSGSTKCEEFLAKLKTD
jgi:hypothetical protein